MTTDLIENLILGGFVTIVGAVLVYLLHWLMTQQKDNDDA